MTATDREGQEPVFREHNLPDCAECRDRYDDAAACFGITRHGDFCGLGDGTGSHFCRHHRPYPDWLAVCLPEEEIRERLGRMVKPVPGWHGEGALDSLAGDFEWMRRKLTEAAIEARHWRYHVPRQDDPE